MRLIRSNRLSRRVIVALAAIGMAAGASLPALAAPAAAATKSVLVVGSITSTTGSCLPFPTTDVLQTNAAWAKSVNAHGGIAGHKVKLLNYNDSCDPGQSAAFAQKLINAHVLAVLDNTEFDTGWQASVTKAGIPILCGIETGNNPSCFTNANFFPSGTTVLSGLYGNVYAAKKAGAKSYGVVYCTELAACAQALPLFKNYSGQLGLTYVNPLAASETASSYTAQCLAFKSEHADAIFPAGPPSDKFAQDCAQQDYRPVITQSAGTWQNRFTKVSALNNTTGSYPDVPWFLKVPATKAFLAAAGKILKNATSPYNVSGAWAAGLLFQYAAAHVGANPTTQDIYQGLYALKGTTLGGFAPPLTFTKGKLPVANCYFVVSIKKGKFVAPQGTKTSCQPTS